MHSTLVSLDTIINILVSRILEWLFIKLKQKKDVKNGGANRFVMVVI